MKKHVHFLLYAATQQKRILCISSLTYPHWMKVWVVACAHQLMPAKLLIKMMHGVSLLHKVCGWCRYVKVLFETTLEVVSVRL